VNAPPAASYDLSNFVSCPGFTVAGEFETVRIVFTFYSSREHVRDKVVIRIEYRPRVALRPAAG